MVYIVLAHFFDNGSLAERRNGEMVARGSTCPRKLKHDAIIEALLEIQFEPIKGVPELFYGRLAGVSSWASFQQLRLPAAEIPDSLRITQPALRYAPVIQLVEPGPTPRIVRMGPQVLSFHRSKKYDGWPDFQPQLETTVDELFAALPDLTVTRIGLRYLNVFIAAQHQIQSMQDLDLTLKIADEYIVQSANVNYVHPVDGVGVCGVRIATPDLVQGVIPDEATLFVDVDVSTAVGMTFQDRGAVKAWIARAHDAEKDEFFHLLKAETIDALKES